MEVSTEIKSFKDLEVWQKARCLAKETREIVRMLPKDERYELGSQMKRASDSIPANIAEGQARISTKEFINFLSIARGSNAELQTQLLLCVDYGYVSDSDASVALGLSDEVGRMLHKLIQSLQKRL